MLWAATWDSPFTRAGGRTQGGTPTQDDFPRCAGKQGGEEVMLRACRRHSMRRRAAPVPHRSPSFSPGQRQLRCSRRRAGGNPIHRVQRSLSPPPPSQRLPAGGNPIRIALSVSESNAALFCQGIFVAGPGEASLGSLFRYKGKFLQNRFLIESVVKKMITYFMTVVH